MEADGWIGVKSLLTNFVGDFNRHIAETFGDQLVEFTLGLPEDVVVKEEKKEEEVKFVHHSVFCDRCL